MELGTAVNCTEGEKGEQSCPCSTLLLCQRKQPAHLLILLLAGCLQAVGILWLGDLSGQDTQKEQTVERNEAIAQQRQEKTQWDGSAVAPGTAEILAALAGMGTTARISRR